MGVGGGEGKVMDALCCLDDPGTATPLTPGVAPPLFLLRDFLGAGGTTATPRLLLGDPRDLDAEEIEREAREGAPPSERRLLEPEALLPEPEEEEVGATGGGGTGGFPAPVNVDPLEAVTDPEDEGVAGVLGFNGDPGGDRSDAGPPGAPLIALEREGVK